MATRYCGDLSIHILYCDAPAPVPSPTAGYYDIKITGSQTWTYGVKVGVVPGQSVDSAKTYDEVAHAAVSFMMDESDEAPGTPEHAPDGSGWVISRSKPTH